MKLLPIRRGCILIALAWTRGIQQEVSFCKAGQINLYDSKKNLEGLLISDSATKILINLYLK